MIVFAIAWGVAARVAARRFQAALAAPLGIHETRRDDPRRIDLDTLERWTHAAGAGDPKHAALARATLARANIDATDLADHLRHDDPDVRAAMFDQLARAPAPGLRHELRAAIAIEDDDRALALGIKALTIFAGDDGGHARALPRCRVSRARSTTPCAAHGAMLGTADELRAELPALLARDAAWAAAAIRASPRGAHRRRARRTAARCDACTPATRAGAFTVIVRAGPVTILGELRATALEAGDPEALAAIEADRCGRRRDAQLRRSLRGRRSHARCSRERWRVRPGARFAGRAARRRSRSRGRARGAAHRARRGPRWQRARRGPDRGRGSRRARGARRASRRARCERGVVGMRAERARDRDPALRRACAVGIRGCVVAAAGRDPGPIAASARHLVGGGEADRRRALDVVQELEARPEAARGDRALAATCRGGQRSEHEHEHDRRSARRARGDRPVAREPRRRRARGGRADIDRAAPRDAVRLDRRPGARRPRGRRRSPIDRRRSVRDRRARRRDVRRGLGCARRATRRPPHPDRAIEARAASSASSPCSPMRRVPRP